MVEKLRVAAFWLALLFIFVLPWENLKESEGGATLGRIVGLLVAGYWAYTVLVRGKMRQLTAFHAAAILFILWNAMSVLWTVDIRNTSIRVMTYLQQIGLLLIIWDLFTEPRQLRAGLQAYVLGAYVTIGGTIYNYYNADAYYYNRYAATGFNPNDAGMILALGIPVAWHLFVSRSSGPRGLTLAALNFLYVPAALLAIFLTAGRATLAGAALGLVQVVTSLRHLRRSTRVVVSVAVVVALVGVYLLVPQKSVDRVTGKGLDLNGRARMWMEGVEIASDHPIIGIGSGAFRTVVESGKAPHNFVLSILAETGVVGLALFFTLLWLAFRAAWRHPPPERVLWMTILAIWVLGASLHNWEQRKQTWLFMSLIVVSSNLPVTRRSERPLRSVSASPTLAPRDIPPLGVDPV